MEIRAENGKIHIEGYVNVVEKPSKIIKEHGKSFREVVKPNVFKRALDKNSDNVHFLLNHDSNKVLGSINDGNVSLREDSMGLKIIADIDDNEEIRQAMEDGTLNGFSYGFVALDDSYREYDGIQLRELNEIELIEVSLLAGKTPAYDGTIILNAETRSINDKPIEIREMVISPSPATETEEEKELRILKEYFTLLSYYIKNS